MGISFDYSATDSDDDTVRKVAAEMFGSGLKPLSDDERLKREAWRTEQAFLSEERRAEREYQQNLADKAARQEEAAEIAERNRQARERMRQEYIVRQERQSPSNDLAAIRFEAQQQGQWRNLVQASVRQQHVQSLYGELTAMLDAQSAQPAAEPEPTIIYGQDEGSPDLGSHNFNPELFNKKPRSWW